MSSYKTSFHKNLRKLRIARGLTQKELAELTGYSEKTVSKWETLGASPTVDGIFAIAGALHANLDELFMESEPDYFLGIDGGGTKTDFALANEKGEVIKVISKSGCNPNDIGFESAKAILSEGIYEVCNGISLSSICMFAGIAGGSERGFRRDFAEFFNSFGFFHFDCDSDSENIISAALGCDDGVTVIMGTGFCVFALENGIGRRYGGYGYFFDEGGCGFNIGRSGLSAFFSSKDGILPPSMLTESIEKASACYGDGFLTHLYKEGKKEIASFAPLVLSCAEKGDDTAMKIVNENITYAEIAIKKALSTFKSGEKIPVILAGGIAKNPLIYGKIREDLKDMGKVELLSAKPYEGAIARAMKISAEKREQND